MFINVYKNILRCNVFTTRNLCYFILCNTAVLVFLTMNTHYSQISMSFDKSLEIHRTKLSVNTDAYVSATNNSTKYKYILLWTDPKCFPFVYFGEGNKVFVDKRCEWNNCFVTGDRNYLRKHSDFDVIAFNGPQMPAIIYNKDTPKERSIHQKYVYTNIESATNYPINTETKYAKKFEGMFNWTWTYKLNSDAVWGYFVIKDANKTVIGPKETMHWLSVEDMEPIDDQLKNALQSKRKTAVWFSSHCPTVSRREDYVQSLQYHLQQYNMDVDIYGECGPSSCPKNFMHKCLEMVRTNYYFYLAFENSFSDDYVTEKILNALNYDTVPVVYGGANYSRFLPEGIYLDAIKLDPKNLARTMYEIIKDPERYYKMFRWKTKYSFHFKHESPDTDDYCKFCANVNNDTLMRTYSVYKNFSYWWMHKQKLMPNPNFL